MTAVSSAPAQPHAHLSQHWSPPAAAFSSCGLMLMLVASVDEVLWLKSCAMLGSTRLAFVSHDHLSYCE
jgi:hypothetical protein